ncbi:MAG: hypothetical protein ACREPJ_10415 [Rhodanobacteraceae bacterium]
MQIPAQRRKRIGWTRASVDRHAGTLFGALTGGLAMQHSRLRKLGVALACLGLECTAGAATPPATGPGMLGFTTTGAA